MAIGTGMALLGSSILGAGSSIAGMSQQKKAARDALAAAEKSKIDINALDNQTREIAKRNANESAELERMLTPEVPLLREQANRAVLGGIGGSADQRNATAFLMSRFSQPTSSASFTPANLSSVPTMGQASMTTPLLNAALEKARSDLAMGGRLSLDQRNEVTRKSAANAGSVGQGLGLGRDISARDLGLTSYGIEQQRLGTAASLSPVELAREQALQSANLSNANFNLNRAALEGNQNLAAANFALNRDQTNQQGFLNLYSLLNAYYNNNRQQDLAAASYGQSIAQPIVGLDPSAIANLTVANSNIGMQGATNAANIRAQQGSNLTNFGGQLLGYGLQNGFGLSGNVTNPASVPAYMSWGRGGS